MAMDEAEKKAFDELKAKAEANEAALKAKTDELTKLTEEVGGLRTKAEADQKAAADAAKVKADADKVAKDKVVADRKAALIKNGLPKDKVDTLSEEGLTIAELTLKVAKPGADLGAGGGGSTLNGISLFELGKMAYTK